MDVVTLIALLLIAAGIALLVFAYISHRNRWQQRLPAPAPLPVRSRRAPVRADVPHALYVYYWRSGGQAYFGISNDPEERHRRHATNPRARWFAATTGEMHIIHVYPNRAAALAAEREAIRIATFRGARLANRQHNPHLRRGRSRA